MDGWLRYGPGDDDGSPVCATSEPQPLRLWRSRAACAGHEETMFADDPEPAKAICEACPVRMDCRAWAVDSEEPYGVWGGLTQEERTRTCPVCGAPKQPEWLGCNFAHNLLRLARLVDLEARGEGDVRISSRQKPSARTAPGCPLPRGLSHSTAGAYKAGCRCAAAREARNGQERRHTGATGTRGSYRRSVA